MCLTQLTVEEAKIKPIKQSGTARKIADDIMVQYSLYYWNSEKVES